MNFVTIENDILSNRGNKEHMNGVIEQMTLLKDKYDWQMNKFLSKYCDGVAGLKKLELDNSSSVYRYYKHKCDQYFKVERMIRVAKAFK